MNIYPYSVDRPTARHHGLQRRFKHTDMEHRV